MTDNESHIQRIGNLSWMTEGRPDVGRYISHLLGKINYVLSVIKPGLKIRGLFFIMHFVQRKGMLEADSSYWKGKGWTGKKRPWR